VVDEDGLPSYSFGDSDLAAERLELVARTFESPSRSFLASAVDRPPRLAMDLGCGPGCSTRLVAEVTRARRTVGLDTSAAFLARAASGAPEGVEFVRHDAGVVPLPGAPADLIYCRLLLAHLPDPARLVETWISQLAPSGRLAVDEVEWIETSHPVLAAYEEAVVGLVASRGAPMYAGPIVAAISGGSGWRPLANVLRTVAVPSAVAARMYRMNLLTWREDPWIRARYPPEELHALAEGLGELATSTAETEISWGLRQVVFERTS
jgi:trans-aconitate 2-methyltransferase